MLFNLEKIGEVNSYRSSLAMKRAMGERISCKKMEKLKKMEDKLRREKLPIATNQFI